MTLLRLARVLPLLLPLLRLRLTLGDALLLLLRGDHGASVLFLQLFGMMVPVPLLMGFGSSWWLLRRRNSL